MSTFFSKFKNKSVPIIGWKFVSTLKEGKGLYNQNTWSGWDNEWTPIATTEVGDVVVIKESCIYEITHGLGESPKPVLITKDIERSLHVKLEAPMEWRTLRASEKYCISQAGFVPQSSSW